MHLEDSHHAPMTSCVVISDMDMAHCMAYTEASWGLLESHLRGKSRVEVEVT